MTLLVLNARLARSCLLKGNRCNHLANKFVLKAPQDSTEPKAHLDHRELKVNADCPACQAPPDFPVRPELKETRVSPAYQDL